MEIAQKPKRARGKRRMKTCGRLRAPASACVSAPVRAYVQLRAHADDKKERNLLKI